MRALFLTTDSFGGHGGIAKYNRDLLTALCTHPSTNEIVAFTRLADDNELGELPAKLVFRTDGLGSKRRFLGAIARQLIRRGRADLVVCGHVNLLPVAVVAAFRHRAPLILCVYGIDVWKAPGWSSAYMCGAIHGFVSISRITAERFRSWAPLAGKREWILPNAIELDRFSPGPKDSKLLDRYGLRGRTVIATLARLVDTERMKGVDEVLEVLPRLVRKRPNIVYLVMGDGSDKSRLEDKTRALGVADHVVFAGRISEAEKVAHYRLADAYVMPSRGEGFGFVFLEALACGIPVVASSIDGGREAVRDGSLGTLVNPQDPDDVERGVEEALAKPAGIVPAGLAYFSFENFVTRVHAFVDDLQRR